MGEIRKENKNVPPRKLRKLLERVFGESAMEDLCGDADEIFHNNLNKMSPAKARWEYNKQIISLMFSYSSRKRRRQQRRTESRTNYYIMNKNYLTIVLRTLKKEKLFSLIRLSNLIIGITISLLCWIYVRYELSYEKFFANYQNIYRLEHDVDKVWAAGPRAAGVFAYENFPQVKSMVRFAPASTLVRLNDKVFQENNILFCDSTVFDVFDYTFIKGNPDKSLTQPYSVVLTETSAKKYFGEEDPIGKTLYFEFDIKKPREVTGIIKDPPSNSHIQFDFLLSIYSEDHDYNTRWGNWGTYAYLLMEPGADLKAIGRKISNEYKKQYQADGSVHLETVFMPLAKIHLYSNAEKEMSANASITYLYIFAFAGLFVLIISIINFVNLTLAKSLDRSKEVGLRKTVGAGKGQLIVQFLTESYLQVIISTLGGLGLVYLITPFFRNLSGLPLPFHLTESYTLATIILFVLLIGLICGAYPAFVLSRFKPAQILQNRRLGGSERSGRMNQFLTITQFVISAILIVGSIVIFRQTNFIRQKDLGFQKDQVIVTHLNYSIITKLEAFETELGRTAGIKEVCHSSSVPGYRVMSEGITDVSSGKTKEMRLLLSSETFPEVYDLNFVEGRSFTKNSNQPKGEWILNEEAVKSLFDEGVDPLGRQLIWHDTAEVVGIVKNFNFQSLHEPVSPLAIYRRPRSSYLSIRFDPVNTDNIMGEINKVYAKVYPNLPPANFEFLDQRFETLYNAENRLQTLVLIFCIISVLLTISGILALTIHYTQRKTKEIAIRKVLGSSVFNIIGIISRHFVAMVIISLLISIPLSWYLCNWWLNQFAYKLGLTSIYFISGGIAIFLVVFLSSLFTTVKTAYTNPIRWLRNE